MERRWSENEVFAQQQYLCVLSDAFNIFFSLLNALLKGKLCVESVTNLKLVF